MTRPTRADLERELAAARAVVEAAQKVRGCLDAMIEADKIEDAKRWQAEAYRTLLAKQIADEQLWQVLAAYSRRIVGREGKA